MTHSDKPRLLFLLAGDDRKASSRIRGYWIAEAMKDLGFNPTIRTNNSKAGLIVSAFLIPSSDIVVFQKTYSRYHILLARLASYLKKTTYLDIDDAPSNIFSEITINNFETMAKLTHGVFAGSTHLLKYIGSIDGRAHLIPTGIKLQNYRAISHRKKTESVCIGWIGNGNQYCRDLLEVLREPLSSLAPNNSLKLKIIGALGNRDLYKGFGEIPSLQTEFVDDIDWSDPQAVASQIDDIDIGVYPLLENKTNPFKCGYKALEYMASSIPVIASPNQANMEIISSGIDGYFASTREEWHLRLQTLISNPALRQKMGENGRATVEKRYRVEEIAERIGAIFLADRQTVGKKNGKPV